MGVPAVFLGSKIVCALQGICGLGYASVMRLNSGGRFGQGDRCGAGAEFPLASLVKPCWRKWRQRQAAAGAIMHWIETCSISKVLQHGSISHIQEPGFKCIMLRSQNGISTTRIKPQLSTASRRPHGRYVVVKTTIAFKSTWPL